MRVAVFGVGGVGGIFGGKLATAPGMDVHFIARGKHLEALQTTGLKVTLPDDLSFTVKPCSATDKPDTLGEMDVILVCTKDWQVAEAAEVIKSSGMVGPETVVLPLQNGLDACATLVGALGPSHVCGATCKVYAFIDGPGHIRCPSDVCSIDFGGGVGGNATDAVSSSHRHLQSLAEAYKQVGIPVVLHADIKPAMWSKFSTICVLSGLGALTRVSWGEILECEETRALVGECLKETLAVAAGHGVQPDAGFYDKALGHLTENLPPEFMASLARDFVAGRPSELEAQVGAVIRLGKEAAVPTPNFSLIYAVLLPMEARARGTSSKQGTSVA